MSESQKIQSPASKNKSRTRDLSQEYGLFDPQNKTDETGPEILDHQQRYDNSIQESEIAPNRPELEEEASEDKNFTRNFYRYSNDFQDNENGAPGVDDDYGIYTAPQEPKVEVDVEEASSDDVLAGSEWMESRPDRKSKSDNDSDEN